MTPPRFLLTVLLALLPAAAGTARATLPPASPIQAPGGALDRLARDQQRLAEQARRLERLLGVLEEKEREAGNQTRAELLARARERLAAAGEQGDLVAVLEAVAADLAALRAGSALEAQAQVIALLEELLDALLDWRMRSQLQALQEAALERVEALERLAAEQERLLQETRERAAASRQQAEDPEAGAAEKKPAAVEELARRQEALNQEMRARQQQEEVAPDQRALEQAARHGEEAARLLDPDRPTPEAGAGQEQEGPEGNQAKPDREQEDPGAQAERLQRATKEQAEALEALRQAAQAARKESERLQEGQRAEDLLDVAREAEKLLERHRAVAGPLEELVAGLGPGRPPRSTRVRLRRWAEEETALSAEAAGLALAIRDRGGDIFPFMLNGLRDDHRLLAGRLGPPGYRAGSRETELAGRITAGWVELIAALRTEAERIRQRIEAPASQGQQGEEQPRPLVEFAAELQLLKRLQENLRERLDGLRRRRATLSAAGLEVDEDDLREIEGLAERQQELRRLYESMLERLRQEQGGGTGRA